MAGPGDGGGGARRCSADAGADTGNVFFHHIPPTTPGAATTARSSSQRDHGGRREQAIVDWGFNAWGGKYPPYDLDDVIPTRIGAELGLPVFHPGIVLEGGSIDVNGARHAAHHRGVPAQPQPQSRSSTAPRSSGYLRDYLGVRKILWLGDGIVGDDTDGHVDDLTRFVDERTVVTVVEDDPADENYEPLQENLERLRGMTDQDGRPLRVVTLPMPRAAVARRPAAAGELRQLLHRQRRRAAADLRSRRATRRPAATLQELFPGRDVVGIDCTDLVWGLGAFHCVTQQWPA